MDATNNFDKIERYLDGELTGAELNAFETALKTDPVLDEEVKAHLLLEEALFAVEEDDVRTNIKQWRAEAKTEEKTSPQRGRLRSLGVLRLAIAASIAVLIGLATFLWLPQQYSNEAILASNYQVDETFLSGDRGRDVSETPADPFAGAAQYYKDGEYGKAAEIYQAFPDNNKALYALGHTHFKSEKYNLAINAFQKLVAKNSIEYNERAEWYLLCSYLAADQTGSEFQQLLDKVIAGGGFYSDKAKEMKDDVNSFWR